ncbi:uncharacterized protein LOC124812305 [Hydra vulgaris]|uniref:uncharacterized protein LOC124812305 n=1 Tax=Hydra vulgaris TaxID=6087 RepID=UPI001F5F6D33|nr:uncharacterized protein LOC124812305 [Hydra vulgaris]
MVTFNLSKLLADNFPPRHIFTSKNVPECAKFLQSKFLSLYADCTVNFNIFKSLAFNLIKKFNECGKRKKFFLTKYKHFLDQNQQCKYLLLEKDSEKEIRTHEEELLLIRKGENLIKQGNQLIKQGERKIKEGELLLRTHGSNVNSVPCRVPKSSAVNTSCTPKPRKSFIKLTNRMKRKRTDSLREREVEELQHAVKRFKSNSSTDGRAILYGSNLSLQALCNLKLTDRTWTEFKNIVTHNRHLVPPGLTKLKQYKKLTYLEQVEYSETEVKCSLFHMIKHSVSRVFEYLLDYESNCIMSLSQEERDNVQIICKVGGDGQSDQSEFQNSATMKRGVDNRSVYSIVFVLLEIRSGEKIIWKNLIPNSPDATRHLLFCFAKETASFIQEKFEHLKNEIFLLKNIEFKLGESTFVVKSSLSTIYTTMNDGKTLNAVVSNML